MELSQMRTKLVQFELHNNCTAASPRWILERGIRLTDMHLNPGCLGQTRRHLMEQGLRLVRLQLCPIR